MSRSRTTLRGVYGKPLAKAVGHQIQLTPEQLRKAGRIILDSIKKEINKDISMASIRQPGEPVPLPKTAKFADSFQFSVAGSVISISSDWPTSVAHTTNAAELDVNTKTPARPSAPIPMVWLTRPSVPYARIVRSNGEVVVRTTPDPRQGDKPWIHPGFIKYTFLERGIRKGRDLAIESLAEEIVAQLLSEYDLF